MKHEISKETISDLVVEDFEYLINAAPNYFISEISFLNYRILKNSAKLALNEFQLDLYITINNLLKNQDSTFESVYFFKKFSDKFFKEMENQIHIINASQLKELEFAIKYSKILLEDAYDNNDLEMFYESFFQLKMKIKDENLIAENDFEAINVEFHITVDFDKINDGKKHLFQNFTEDYKANNIKIGLKNDFRY